MRIMNDQRCLARFFPFSCAMCERLSGLTAELRGTGCANSDGIDLPMQRLNAP
jgi:hypothetical protein